MHIFRTLDFEFALQIKKSIPEIYTYTSGAVGVDAHIDLFTSRKKGNPMKTKSLIAMSGGVDSSVAAYLMQKSGYDCMGATMRLYDKYAQGDQRNLSDINDAKSVCDTLGIDFHTFDCRKEFEYEVIRRFILSYESGGTPNPCIECNRYMKFGLFLAEADRLGCNVIATGHYARIEQSNGRFYLKKAADAKKDQTYFLYSLTQSQLSRTVFPLGDLTKEQIRSVASDRGFVSAHKSDSQDICFVPDGDYIGIIRAFTRRTYPQGDFVDVSGRVIGAHQGIINYTIGQRKGLGTAFGQRLYVKEKDAVQNRVVLAQNEDLFSNSLDADDFNWIAFDTPPSALKAKAKVRYSQKEDECTVFVIDTNKVHIEFNTPQRAIAKGQAVVLYDGGTVLGGGTII